MNRKVLFISDHGDPLATLGGKQAGGQNNYVKQLALALDELGFSIDVVTHWSDPKAPQIEKFGNDCRVIRIAAGHKGYIDKNEMFHILPKFYREMKGLLTRNAYRIIHSHYWLSGMIGLVLRRNFNIPLVHTSHSLAIAKLRGTGKKETRRLIAEKSILKNADAVIATTPNEKQLIQEFAGRTENVVESSIGVNFNTFFPGKSDKQEDIMFTFAGRLEKTKGILTLLDAFQLLMQRNPNIQLVIVGGDKKDVDCDTFLPNKKELLEAIRGIEGNVWFVGPKSQEELAQIFHRSTAVVVPSYYESFGMVAAEAQACGTPVIASKVGGLNDIILDGHTGFHVEPKNAEQLSNVMYKLSKNKRLVKKVGKQAAKYSQKVFDWRKIAKQIIQTYERLVKKHEKVRASY